MIYAFVGHSQDSSLFFSGSDTFKNTSFPHGIELLRWIVMFVEVRISLFPGLGYCELQKDKLFLRLKKNCTW